MQAILNKIKDVFSFIKSRKIIIIPAAIVAILVAAFILVYKSPITPEGMLTKADELTKKGQVALAIEEYNKIVRLYPNNYDVHLRLADVYATVNEPERAKIEYLRAIRLGQKLRYEANIALANIYILEQHYDIAEELIRLLEDNPLPKVRGKIGDFYYSWADTLKEGDRLEAIRKYKEAANYYKLAGNKTEKAVVDQVIRLYGDISDTLMENGEVDNAVEILKIAIEYNDNAVSHYKLAKIYEKHFTIDTALSEYEAAYKLNPDLGSKNSYKSLLLKKAQIYAEHGDKLQANFYRIKAKKIDTTVEVPMLQNKKFIFSLISTRVNEDIDRDILVPGIIFKISNISKYPLMDVKAKVVFIEGGKPFSTKVVAVASETNPLKGDTATKDISVYAGEPVKHVFDEHDLMVQVFFSQAGNEDWKLYKNVKIERNRKPLVLTK